MFRNPELARLFNHKQKLLAQSEGNRVQLAAAWENLCEPASKLERGISFFRETRFIWMLAAPLLGFLVVRKWWSLARIATTLISGFRLSRTVLAVWQGFRQTRAGDE
jgi:hypothetical protein